MEILPVTKDNAGEWATLCNELWPRHRIEEMLEAYHQGEYEHEYIVRTEGQWVGFLSLSIRREYVEGKEDDSRPVGYVEGIYIKPSHRRRGIGRKLVEFAKEWSHRQGCSMLASDCALSNPDSRLFHRGIGFEEAGINVHFKMHLEG